ncbi:MAG: hypothetical protein JXP73_02145 [Deltaproteobacteria bacterium]|nr:hypothetical protein [Deltaproteobacteria bacterium]
MAGTKTRFGFSGASDPPDTKESRSARTVFGRDIHLQVPSEFSAPPSPTPVPPALPYSTPAAPVPAPLPEQESTNPIPVRRQRPLRKSRLARFFGRWTRSGRFEASSRMGFDGTEDLELPRDTTGRNVLVVLMVALLAFLVTFAVVKLRQRFLGPPPASTAPMPPARQPSAVTAAASPEPATPPAASPAAASVPVPAAAKGLGAVAPGAHTGRRGRQPLAKPPAHLRNELLPFQP